MKNLTVFFQVFKAALVPLLLLSVFLLSTVSYADTEDFDEYQSLPKTPKITVVLSGSPNAESSRWLNDLQKGFKAEFADCHVYFAENSHDKQANFIKKIIEKETLDIAFIEPVDMDKAAEIVDLLHKKDSKVCAINKMINHPALDYFIGTDLYGIGTVLAGSAWYSSLNYPTNNAFVMVTESPRGWELSSIMAGIESELKSHYSELKSAYYIENQEKDTEYLVKWLKFYKEFSVVIALEDHVYELLSSLIPSLQLEKDVLLLGGSFSLNHYSEANKDTLSDKTDTILDLGMRVATMTTESLSFGKLTYDKAIDIPALLIPQFNVKYELFKYKRPDLTKEDK